MTIKSDQCPNHQAIFEDVVIATRDIQAIKETLTIVAARAQEDHDVLTALNAKVAAFALMGSAVGGALMQIVGKYL
jgi:hypothetical protein